MSTAKFTETQTDSGVSAITIVILAVLAYSIGPSVIHLTGSDSNPFYYNLFFAVSHVLILFVFVALTKRHFVGDLISKDAPKLNRINLWTSHFQEVRPTAGTQKPRVSLETASVRSPTSWIKLPLVWTFLSSFQYIFFVWGTHYTETAVVSTIFQSWPIFVVYGAVIYERRDRIYRNVGSGRESPTRESQITVEQVILTALAGIGLWFILGSQASNNLPILRELVYYKAIAGMLLGLIGAVLGAMGVLGTLQLGSAVFYRLVDEPRSAPNPRERPGDRDKRERRLLLWLTVLGIALSRTLGIPVFLALGLATSSNSGELSSPAVLGGIILGITSTAGSVLLRLGNIRSDSPAVNALALMTPALGLVGLMVLGVSLPQFDLFLIGAALILVVNILIQKKPDMERDPSRLNSDYKPRPRLGFTAFILSIWTFGTVILLRDEIMPDSWLEWSGLDYWGLVALSATIFALLLGFRVSRLSSQIATEDETMLSLFRDVEYLSRAGMLDDWNIRTKLADLDRARPHELRDKYNEIRADILKVRVQFGNDDLTLLSAEKRLDTVAHSKQQGRDIVELLSLVAFAAITIGLGLFARPIRLDAAGAWSGFLSEVFVLVFASTVAFLCFNLFDIRGERDAPLLVSLQDHEDDYRLFFRNERNRTSQHRLAVIISIVMAIVFCALLYGKWLGPAAESEVVGYGVIWYSEEVGRDLFVSSPLI